MAALIWGLAFTAQQVGGEALGAFSFNGSRSFIGAAVLFPLFLFMRSRKSEAEKEKQDIRTTIAGGIICGFFLFIAGSLQQVGLLYTTVGKAGFITTLYIVVVPILSIFIGKKAGKRIWVAVALALVGLYMLCINEKLSLSRGDALTLLAALAFSFHILSVDHFCDRTDNVLLSCIQFLVCGVLSLGPILFVEHPQAIQFQAALIPLLYAGVLSCGVAYTLQIVGQKNVSPAAASIIMSMESVFSVLGGWVILHQTMNGRELFGCLLMFSASILAQLPARRRTETTVPSGIAGYPEVSE